MQTPSPPWPGAARSAALAAVVLVPLLLGCPSLTTMGTARTLAPGQHQAFLAAGAYRTQLVTGSGPTAERSEAWFPLLEGGGRIGVADRFDVWARAGLAGASAGGRLQLARSETPDAGIDALLDLGLGFTGVLLDSRSSTATGFAMVAGLPAGINLGSGHQLVLSPRAAVMVDQVVGSSTLLGGSLALAVRLGGDDARPWLLIPECALASVTGGSDGSYDGPVLQCALGLAGW